MGKESIEGQVDLPPGFRFFPTDEELVVHYLCNKVASRPLPALVIGEVDLYKYDPWQLPEKALFGEKEWYFFTPRDRKYPNGSRPNRAAGSGYWKATGADKPITTSGGTKRVGVKKALVFYTGKAPKGCKTNWIMHEYRIAEINKSAKRKDTLRLDDWVLCRIYNKKSSAEKIAKDKKNGVIPLNENTNTHLDIVEGDRENLHITNSSDCPEPSSDGSSRCAPSSTNCANNASPHDTSELSPVNFSMASQNSFFQHTANAYNNYTFRSPHSNTAAAPIQPPEGHNRLNCPTTTYAASTEAINPPGLPIHSSSSTEVINRGLPIHSSSSTRPLSSDLTSEKEEVQSSFRLMTNSITKQQNHGLNQSLFSFNFNLEGLQSPFLQFEQPPEPPLSNPYQEYIDSLSAPGYLQRSFQNDNDMLLH
eukprot:Gb_17883 [translate_table: standard]